MQKGAKQLDQLVAIGSSLPMYHAYCLDGSCVQYDLTVDKTRAVRVLG